MIDDLREIGPVHLARQMRMEAERFSHATKSKADQPAQDAVLSQRELEILRAVARGLRNKEIADRLPISERSVRARLAGIFNKRGVGSRAGAGSPGMARGLIRDLALGDD